MDHIMGGKTRTVTLLSDTRSQAPLIGPQHMELFGEVKLKQTKDKITMANNSRFAVIGLVDVTMRAGENTRRMQAYVIKELMKPILDYKSLVPFDLIKEGWPRVRSLLLDKAKRRLVELPRTKWDDIKIREKFFVEFPEVLPDDEVIQPLAKMNGQEMEIELVEGAEPYKQYKVNNIPLHWREPVKKQLDTMVEKDITEVVPVGENPEWVLGMVCV